MGLGLWRLRGSDDSRIEQKSVQVWNGSVAHHRLALLQWVYIVSNESCDNILIWWTLYPAISRLLPAPLDSAFTERIMGLPVENYKAYVEADATQKAKNIDSDTFFLIHGLGERFSLLNIVGRMFDDVLFIQPMQQLRIITASNWQDRWLRLAPFFDIR